MVSTKPKALLVFLLLALFVLQGVYLVNRASTTNDESFHVKAGGLYFQTGQFGGGFHNPPMLQTVLGLPDGVGWAPYDILKARPPYWSRYINLLLGTLTAFAVFLVACRFFGENCGLLSLAMYALSPSLTAHSALATTDIGVTLWLFIFVALVAAADKHDAPSSFVIAGLALGAAIASKLTAMAFIGLMPLLYIGQVKLARKDISAALLPIVLVLIMVYLVLSASYGFKGAFTSKQYIMPERPMLMATLFPLPKLAAEAIIGKMSFASGGCASYILGRKYRYGTVWFYPAVLLVKLPLGLLVALIALAIRSCMGPKDLLSPAGLYLILPALFLLATMTIGNRHQTGVRHLFPIFPFLYVLAGSLASWGKRCLPFVVLIVLLQAGSALSTFPEGLAYVNSLGTLLSTGPVPLAGPDSDWGQSDFVLRDYFKSLPAEDDKWVNPYPANIPVAGWVAVSACSRVFGSGHDTVPYQWLMNFKEKETVGGSWTIFRIPKDAYRELATEHPNDWEKQELHLRYLYYGKKFQECAAEALEICKRFPGARLYHARALLLLGKYEQACESFKKLSIIAGGRLSGPSALWQNVSLYFAGEHPEPEREACAFSYTMLNLLDSEVTDELRKQLEDKELFDTEVMPDDPQPWARFAWVFKHRQRKEWQKELALLVTLKDFAFPDYINSSLRPLRAIAESTMTQEPRFVSQRLMEAAYSPHWSKYAYNRLLQHYKNDPTEFYYIISIVLVQMKRRASWAAYDAGMGSIYDELERNGRWIGE